MPLKSKKQMRWMFANHPAMAKRWAEHTPSIKELPETASDESKDAPKAKEASMSISADIVDAFQLAGAALEQAEKAYMQKQAQAAEVASLIPEVVEALLSNGCIDATEKEAAARAMSDPIKVLKILIKTASFRPESEQTLGRSADSQGRTQTKKASVVPGSLESCYVGARTTRTKTSDEVLLRGLGMGHLIGQGE